jgi:hypothetical protein
MASNELRSRRATPALLVLLLSGVALIPAAWGGPVIHVSRSTVAFGYVAQNFASPVQPVFITNTGDAALNMAQVSIAGARAGDFTLSGTCATPSSLAPGRQCRIDIVMQSSAPRATPFAATLVIQSDATPAETSVTLTGTVDPTVVGVPILVPTPAYVDFGEHPVGSPASQLVLTIFNATALFNFKITALVFAGGNAADFSLVSPCADDKKLSVGQSCAITVTFNPQDTGPRSTELLIGLAGTGVTQGATADYSYSITGFGKVGTLTQPVTVVEYYNQALDHYFITWVPNEIAVLDAGIAIKGWTRTGKSFRTYPTAQTGTASVCRFYIPPAKGDSHFFGRGTVECTATGQKNPTFELEDPAFMQMYLPDAGVCPPNTVEVYRVFSNRLDANHRYMVDPSVRDEMVARGWLAEGDGPHLVVMCAP